MTPPHPVPFAFLLPKLPGAISHRLEQIIDSATLASLRSASFATPKHFALVEICRRAYKRRAMEIDRDDKQEKLAEGWQG